MVPGEQESGGPLASLRRADGAVRWMEAGSLSEWAPTYGPRHAHVAIGGLALKVAVTRAEPASGDRSVGEWVRWQRQLVLPPDRTASSETVLWWRLTVHQRVFALCATPCPDLGETVSVLRRIVRRAPDLTVMFGHRPGQAVPDWVVLDGETPVFVGMPGYPLAGVVDRGESLATMLRTARFHRYVHDIHGRRPHRTPVAIPLHEADLSREVTRARIDQ